MGVFKIVIGGHFGAGKTTLIKGLSEIKPSLTEAKLTESEVEEYKDKLTTTVGVEYGKINYGKYGLYLFGIPGQNRFSFVWESVAKGVKGYIFLVDSTKPNMWDQTLDHIDYFMNKYPAPFIIGANKQDLKDAHSPIDIKIKLFGDEDVRVVPISALNGTNTQDLIRNLIEEILKSDRSKKTKRSC